jgi:hypothetical protein
MMTCRPMQHASGAERLLSTHDGDTSASYIFRHVSLYIYHRPENVVSFYQADSPEEWCAFLFRHLSAFRPIWSHPTSSCSLHILYARLVLFGSAASKFRTYRVQKELRRRPGALSAPQEYRIIMKFTFRGMATEPESLGD